MAHEAQRWQRQGASNPGHRKRCFYPQKRHQFFMALCWENMEEHYHICIRICIYIYIHIYILYIYIYTGTDPQNLADATVRYPIRSNVAPNLGIRVYQVSGTAPYHDGLLITRTS